MIPRAGPQLSSENEDTHSTEHVEVPIRYRRPPVVELHEARQHPPLDCRIKHIIFE